MKNPEISKIVLSKNHRTAYYTRNHCNDKVPRHLEKSIFHKIFQKMISFLKHLWHLDFKTGF